MLSAQLQLIDTLQCRPSAGNGLQPVSIEINPLTHKIYVASNRILKWDW